MKIHELKVFMTETKFEVFFFFCKFIHTKTLSLFTNEGDKGLLVPLWGTLLLL